MTEASPRTRGDEPVPTRLFAVLVTSDACPPMRVSIRAENSDRALLYAGNRWPGSRAGVVD